MRSDSMLEAHGLVRERKGVVAVNGVNLKLKSASPGAVRSCNHCGNLSMYSRVLTLKKSL